MVRIMIQKFEKEIEDKKIRLIIGVDTSPVDAPNAICYLRTESQYKRSDAKRHEEFWLSLKEFEQLGMFLLIASKFWGEKQKGGSIYGEKKIRRLKKFWEELRDYWPQPSI